MSENHPMRPTLDQRVEGNAFHLRYGAAPSERPPYLSILYQT